MKESIKKDIIAETKVGIIKGKSDNNICVWRGIPYALTPTGEFRFKRAVYRDKLENIFDAANFGSQCMQPGRIDLCNEDSLTLNIWSKSVIGKRPVIFYIHGGSFANGSGSDSEYDGCLLANDDVVVVTINYRLGILGMSDFTFLGNRFETNCGLSDIICALKWVKNNIEAFGGDPDNITIMGQSAGAIAISALLIIPEAQQCISKAVMMSGSPTLMHTKRQCMHLSQEFMQFSGLETANSLIDADAHYLTGFQPGFAKQCGLGEGTFAIEIDNDLLHEFPILGIKNGKGTDIPLLIGSTREEMSFMFVKPLNKIFDLGGIFQAGVEGEDQVETNKIDKAYDKFGKKKNAIMLSDLVFRMPSVWFAEVYSKTAPTWMYRFDYESFIMRITKLYSFHYTDIPMIFGNTNASFFKFIYPGAKISHSFQKVSKEMKHDFLEFIHTGKLNWQKCSETETPAKCYNRITEIKPIVDEDIKAVYLNSNFYKRSMNGLSNNLN